MAEFGYRATLRFKRPLAGVNRREGGGREKKKITSPPPGNCRFDIEETGARCSKNGKGGKTYIKSKLPLFRMRDGNVSEKKVVFLSGTNILAF